MAEAHAHIDAIHEAAIAWHLRLPELPGEQWEEFVAWLETAPAHRAAYDQVVLADGLAGEGLAHHGRDGRLAAPAAPVPAAVSHDPVGRRVSALRRHLRPLALTAAAAVAVIAAVGLWPQATAPQLEETRAGITKQLDFADGTRIDLNGETALALDQSDPRRVELHRGEARFAVRHGARPFTVTAGGFVLQDLGTVFNVQLTATALVLDVTEGKVLFDPGGANLAVGAGEQVAVDRERNIVVKRDRAAPGDWLRGELAFDNATLADVADAVHRRFGINVLLSAGLQARSFSGNIRLSGNPETDVPHLARLIGADYRRDGQGWIITEAAGRR